MSGRLAGKVAIITGAGCIGPGWGNGRAAAVLFAQEGARVFAVDNDADAMEETLARASNHEIVAHAALFLASDEARFITGTEIIVDGGMTARCD